MPPYFCFDDCVDTARIYGFIATWEVLQLRLYADVPGFCFGVTKVTHEQHRRVVESGESSGRRYGGGLLSEKGGKDGVLATIILIGGVPDDCSLAQSFQNLPGVAAFNYTIVMLLAAVAHAILHDRVLVAPINNIEINFSGQHCACDIESREVRPNENHTTFLLLCPMQVFEPFYCHTVPVDAAKPGNGRFYQTDSRGGEDTANQLLLLLQSQFRKTQVDIGSGNVSPRQAQATGQPSQNAPQVELGGKWQPGEQPHRTHTRPGQPVRRVIQRDLSRGRLHRLPIVSSPADPCVSIGTVMNDKTKRLSGEVSHGSILVLGDLMLDRYWRGDAHRISAEAPVPVVNVTGSDERPGGAANVALNIVAMGGRCILIGAVGQDDASQVLRAKLTAAGVECAFVDVPDWSTIVKLRILSNDQQLLRMDFEQPLPAGTDADLMRLLEQHINRVDTLVLQDYDKGVLGHPQDFIDLAQPQVTRILVDPKFKPLQSYAGATLLKPNAEEFRYAVGTWNSHEELVQKGRSSLHEADVDALLITAGEAGMTLVQRDGEAHHIPARPVGVHDVTGAGDTVTAALSVALSRGASMVEAAALSNAAGGIAVTKPGTAVVSEPEIDRAMGQAEGRGLMSLDQARKAVSESHARNERVVFTNGCFDILHAGHVAYLEQAKTLGDRLLVALNDDAGVARLKGKGRPVNALSQRVSVLAGLECVDWVVPFSTETPEEMLRSLEPDVLVKGGDYQLSEVVGKQIVESYGGEVRVLDLVENCSTTELLNRMSDT